MATNNKKKVDMPKRKNKYLADKLGELTKLGKLTGDYQKVGARGTFNNLYKNLKNKV